MILPASAGQSFRLCKLCKLVSFPRLNMNRNSPPEFSEILIMGIGSIA